MKRVSHFSGIIAVTVAACIVAGYPSALLRAAEQGSDTAVPAEASEDPVDPDTSADAADEAASDNVDAVREFVERLYGYCLSRSSDEEGLEYWSSALIDDEIGGYETSLGFFNSDEFTSRDISTEEFVTICYNTFLDRAPDETGLAYWVDAIDSGELTRNQTISSFCSSEEFTELCQNIGIRSRFPQIRNVYPEACAVLDSVGWDLRAAYDWCVHNITYVRDQSMNDTNYTSHQLARIGFTTHGGNCYVYAACFYELAMCLGYDAHQISGMVPSRRGGNTIHSWVEIDMDQSMYVFDPEFEYVDPVNRDGWQFHYGRPGTWVYVSHYRMN